MAKVDCSGLAVSELVLIFGEGTGMYDVILPALVCLWIEYSDSGPSGVWMLTAKPLKHGILDLIVDCPECGRSLGLCSLVTVQADGKHRLDQPKTRQRPTTPAGGQNRFVQSLV